MVYNMSSSPIAFRRMKNYDPVSERTGSDEQRQNADSSVGGNHAGGT